MADSLLDGFVSNTSGAPTNRTPSERIAIQVQGYFVPNQGPETVENARIVGIRCDTGEQIEVALRESDAADRKGIRNFYNDQGSPMPVTTQIGGTIAVDGAYQDSRLSALSRDGRPVYNGHWLKRLTGSEEEGYAVRSLVRVNEPKLKNLSNPADGYYQNLTVLMNKPVVVKSTEHLNKLLRTALDGNSVRFDAQGNQARPGTPMAMIRLSQGNVSKALELRSGFTENPYAEGPRKVIKPIDEIMSDLEQNARYQKSLPAIQQAIEHADYTVEVLAGSTLSVGPKTLQKYLANAKTSGVNGVSITDENGTSSLYVDALVGIRYSQKTGRPSAIYCRPVFWNPMATMTGKPSDEERSRYHESLSNDQQQTAQEAQPAPAAAPQQAAPQQAAPIQQQAQRPAPQQSMQNTQRTPAPQQPAQRTAAPQQPVQQAAEAVTISLVASEVPNQMRADFEPADYAALFSMGFTAPEGVILQNQHLIFAADKMPLVYNRLNEVAKTQGIQAQVHVAGQAPSPVQQAAQQTPAATPQHAAPAQQPAAQQPQQSTPARQQDDGLSGLDFNDLDLDSALEDAYSQNSTFGHSR